MHYFSIYFDQFHNSRFFKQVLLLQKRRHLGEFMSIHLKCVLNVFIWYEAIKRPKNYETSLYQMKLETILFFYLTVATVVQTYKQLFYILQT